MPFGLLLRSRSDKTEINYLKKSEKKRSFIQKFYINVSLKSVYAFPSSYFSISSTYIFPNLKASCLISVVTNPHISPPPFSNVKRGSLFKLIVTFLMLSKKRQRRTDRQIYMRVSSLKKKKKPTSSCHVFVGSQVKAYRLSGRAMSCVYGNFFPHKNTVRMNE